MHRYRPLAHLYSAAVSASAFLRCARDFHVCRSRLSVAAFVVVAAGCDGGGGGDAVGWGGGGGGGGDGAMDTPIDADTAARARAVTLLPRGPAGGSS